MFTAILIRMLSILSPRLKRPIWKLVYEQLASSDFEAQRASSFGKFMNWGFVDLDPGAPPIALHPEDEMDRLSIHLYHHVATGVDPRDKEIMEVGCGRGGGASYVMRYLEPRRVVGVDIAESNITRCREYHAVPGLSFSQGDAENLPAGDASFDIVINVESSHCYPSRERFFTEVRRVLRPGGHFLYADVIEDVNEVRRELGRAGLEIVRARDITDNVLGSRDQSSHGEVSKSYRGRFKSFLSVALATPGSPFYQALRDGSIRYYAWVVRRPEAA